MNEGSEVLSGLHVDEEDGHHQIEAGCAEADPVHRRVAHQHLTVAPSMRLVAHHVEERHLKHEHWFFSREQDRPERMTPEGEEEAALLCGTKNLNISEENV